MWILEGASRQRMSDSRASNGCNGIDKDDVRVLKGDFVVVRPLCLS